MEADIRLFIHYVNNNLDDPYVEFYFINKNDRIEFKEYLINKEIQVITRKSMWLLSTNEATKLTRDNKRNFWIKKLPNRKNYPGNENHGGYFLCETDKRFYSKNYFCKSLMQEYGDKIESDYRGKIIIEYDKKPILKIL